MLRRVLFAVLIAVSCTPALAQWRVGLVVERDAVAMQQDWQPVLDDLARQLRTPLQLRLFASEAELQTAFARGEIEIARSTPHTALALIESAQARIFAKQLQSGHEAGTQALLLTRDPKLTSLKQILLTHRGTLRYARGGVESTLTRLVPDYLAFANGNVLPEQHFGRLVEGNSLRCFMALVRGEVDVAAISSDQLEKLQESYPRDAAQLRVIWRSRSFSGEPWLISLRLSAAQQQRITQAWLGYARSGPQASQQQSRLYYADMLSGFAASNNRQLREITDLQLFDSLFRISLSGQPQPVLLQQQNQLYTRYNQLARLLGGVL